MWPTLLSSLCSYILIADCFRLLAQSASHLLMLVPCLQIFLPWRWMRYLPLKCFTKGLPGTCFPLKLTWNKINQLGSGICIEHPCLWTCKIVPPCFQSIPLGPTLWSKWLKISFPDLSKFPSILQFSILCLYASVAGTNTDLCSWKVSGNHVPTLLCLLDRKFLSERRGGGGVRS
jgi:hypothetical protein